jgi:hypothetical protein
LFVRRSTAALSLSSILYEVYAAATPSVKLKLPRAYAKVYLLIVKAK